MAPTPTQVQIFASWHKYITLLLVPAGTRGTADYWTNARRTPTKLNEQEAQFLLWLTQTNVKTPLQTPLQPTLHSPPPRTPQAPLNSPAGFSSASPKFSTPHLVQDSQGTSDNAEPSSPSPPLPKFPLLGQNTFPTDPAPAFSTSAQHATTKSPSFVTNTGAREHLGTHDRHDHAQKIADAVRSIDPDSIMHWIERIADKNESPVQSAIDISDAFKSNVSPIMIAEQLPCGNALKHSALIMHELPDAGSQRALMALSSFGSVFDDAATQLKLLSTFTETARESNIIAISQTGATVQKLIRAISRQPQPMSIVWIRWVWDPLALADNKLTYLLAPGLCQGISILNLAHVAASPIIYTIGLTSVRLAAVVFQVGPRPFGQSRLVGVKDCWFVTPNSEDDKVHGSWALVLNGVDENFVATCQEACRDVRKTGSWILWRTRKIRAKSVFIVYSNEAALRIVAAKVTSSESQLLSSLLLHPAGAPLTVLKISIDEWASLKELFRYSIVNTNLAAAWITEDCCICRI